MLWFLLVAPDPATRAFCRAAFFWLLGPCVGGAAVLLGTSGASADADACLDAHERAQVDRLQGHYLAARERLRVCAQRECPRLVSTDCTTWLAELDITLPTVVFAVSDNAGRDLLEARVIVNGRLIANHTDGHAVPLDPGVYTVRFEAEGYTPDEQTLSVREGEKSRLARGTLSPLEGATSAGAAPTRGDPGATVDAHGAGDPRARRLRIATYTLGAAALASFSVTLAASLRGHHMEKVCDQACSDAYAERGKRLYRTVNVSAIVGGALLAGATVTLITGLRRERSHDGMGLGVAASADAGGASVTAWSRW